MNHKTHTQCVGIRMTSDGHTDATPHILFLYLNFVAFEEQHFDSVQCECEDWAVASCSRLRPAACQDDATTFQVHLIFWLLGLNKSPSTVWNTF